FAKVVFAYKQVAGMIAEKGYVVWFIHYFARSHVAEKDIAALKDEMRNQLLDQQNKKSPQRLEKLYREWMDTVKVAVVQLRQQPMVNKERVGLVGLSMGGFLATSTVVEYGDLKLAAVVNVCGGLPD